jgi:hypothetical protein
MTPAERKLYALLNGLVFGGWGIVMLAAFRLWAGGAVLTFIGLLWLVTWLRSRKNR